NHERPVCSASSMIGTKPAADTRFGSSNIADPTVNACDDCTGNAFRTRDYFDFENRYCPSSGGIFAVHTPITNDRPSTDSGLASCASARGSRCPAISASIIARPDMPCRLVSTAEILIGRPQAAFHPLLLTGTVLHQDAPVAGQIAQPTDLGWLHQRGPTHAPLSDF